MNKFLKYFGYWLHGMIPLVIVAATFGVGFGYITIVCKLFLTNSALAHGTAWAMSFTPPFLFISFLAIQAGIQAETRRNRRNNA